MVEELLESFDGLADIANDLGERVVRLAQLAGFEAPADFFAAQGPYQPVDPQCFLQEGKEYAHAVAAFPWARAGSFMVPAETLVRETWKLPWPWLTLELVEMLMRMLRATILGCPIPVHVMLYTPAPHTVLNFETRKGESSADALRRLSAMYHEVAATLNLAPSPDDARRGAVVKPDIIRRDVGWFYRWRIKRPLDTLGVLAREYTNALNDRRGTRTPRATIKYGIRRAERLLGTIPVYRYP